MNLYRSDQYTEAAGHGYASNLTFCLSG